MKKLFIFLLLAIGANVAAQDSFQYHVELEPVTIPNMPGIHSYAKAQHNGKWLIIGGRRDGLHARQPFNAFPENQNNTEIFVVDIASEQYWSTSIDVLPTTLEEQMQSTNMNFAQRGDTLYFTGGYGYSATQQSHITHPFLTTIDVPNLMDAVINGNDISPYFKQVEDAIFAVTGGHLDALGDTLYLVGGHRFDGAYNPMGNNTYTQSYVNGIRKFTVDNSGSQPTFGNYSEIIDPVHLRRRDYNLVPQIFPDGSEGFMISSGVFQQNANLPFLYPVDIDKNGYYPNTSFNQYLSNYHSPRLALHHADSNEMHALFFGGMSQYYYENGSLIEDTDVPFVKTISRVTRYSDGTMVEYQNPTEMPGLKGASAEFFTNPDLPQNDHEVIHLEQIVNDTIVAGYIVGGITSPTLNPFSNNNTGVTEADPTIYRVKLIYDESLQLDQIDGKNPYDFNVFPNPANDNISLDFNLDNPAQVDYFITNVAGEIVAKGKIEKTNAGENSHSINLNDIAAQPLTVTLIIDHRYYLTKQIIKVGTKN
ncbi:MAG: hypothetical protein ACQERC_02685 [Bacteroidota bacterium]